jgi:hypothetical protein
MRTCFLLCMALLMTGQLTSFPDGIVTSVCGQAAFDAALSGLTFADDSEKALLPYGMVIQNDGPFTVVAYCLQWSSTTATERPSSRSTLIHNHLHSMMVSNAAPYGSTEITCLIRAAHAS